MSISDFTMLHFNAKNSNDYSFRANFLCNSGKTLLVPLYKGLGENLPDFEVMN